jgi:hypothetical protein
MHVTLHNHHIHDTDNLVRFQEFIKLPPEGVVQKITRKVKSVEKDSQEKSNSC